jgi:hypothetical protein
MLAFWCIRLPLIYMTWFADDPAFSSHLKAANLILLIQRRLLSSFPPNTNIRAIPMRDNRGLPLPAEFLLDVSDIAPPSLEYIRWDIDGKKHVYKLRKSVDGWMEARESEPVREFCSTAEADMWTSESILDHLKLEISVRNGVH